MSETWSSNEWHRVTFLIAIEEMPAIKRSNRFVTQPVFADSLSEAHPARAASPVPPHACSPPARLARLAIGLLACLDARCPRIAHQDATCLAHLPAQSSTARSPDFPHAMTACPSHSPRAARRAIQDILRGLGASPSR